MTGTKRLEVLPDIPAVVEHVPGFELFSWFGVGAPRGTPAEIIDRLNKEITGGLANPKVNARIAELGAAVLPLSPAEFGKLITDESEKWAKVVKFARLKPE